VTRAYLVVDQEESVPGRMIMGRAASILMTKDEIRTELGWSDEMVRRLLQLPAAPAS
jgi:hypothetical protein